MAEYLRGAFIAYDGDGYSRGTADLRRIIPFRINPEGFSRSLAIEPAPTQQGVEGAGGKAANSTNEQSADASAGTLKETFAVQVRLDLVDRLESAVSLDQKLGILPEIAALEDLLYPSQSDANAHSDGKESVRSKDPRPTVLFVWGTQRIVPVKITGMSINETLHNAELNPVRAEVEVTMEVLREADASGNPAVRDSLKFTDNNRRTLSRSFLDRTAAQNTNVPKFP
jgi:hypothetical protein